MIVFSQGTCRVGFPLTCLHGQGKIELIDTHWDAAENGFGDIPAMTLGHFHNIHDHLRIFKLLQDDSNKKEMKKALKQINRLPIDPKRFRNRLDWKEVWEHCRDKFVNCDIAVVELSSFHPVGTESMLSLEDTSERNIAEHLNPNCKKLEETIEYMREIERLIPHCKKLWVCHYRPSVIWKKYSHTRETLYQAIEQMEHYFDPSPFIAKDEKNLLHGDKHYSPNGVRFIAERMLEKMESMMK